MFERKITIMMTFTILDMQKYKFPK